MYVIIPRHEISYKVKNAALGGDVTKHKVKRKLFGFLPWFSKTVFVAEFDECDLFARLIFSDYKWHDKNQILGLK